MESLSGSRLRRYAAVTAAHHFLSLILPIREPESRNALDEFVARLRRCDLADSDAEAIIVRVLAKLDLRILGRHGGLVCQYVSMCLHPRLAIDVLRHCVDGLLQHRAFGHPMVSQVTQILIKRSADSSLRQGDVAAIIGVKSSGLGRAFRRYTGQTFRSYLRNVRLDHAASLLTSSRMSIKEVWVSVGYNHPSNFIHDFKRRFDLSPREFRARSMTSFQHESAVSSPCRSQVLLRSEDAARTVLVVDDDDVTRETLGRYLRLEGYHVILASSGAEAIAVSTHVELDSILLDFHLTDMDGLCCLRSLRASRRTANTRIVIMTADWDIDDHSDAIRALGATIVFKLCDLEDIRQVVKG